MIRHGRVAPRRLPRRAVQDSLGPTARRRATLSSRVPIRAAAVALSLVLVLFVALAPVTTATSATAFTYDSPANARVDAQAFRGCRDQPATRPGGLWEGSAARFVDADDAPTTSPGSFIATNTVSSPIESGNYVVSTPTGEYVGQSGNISTRLEQHVASGRFTQAEVDAAQRFAVPGAKLDREIAEQLLIDSKGGIDNLLNKVNPIGPKRFGVMPNQPYVR